jgi:hypothetical protein
MPTQAACQKDVSIDGRRTRPRAIDAQRFELQVLAADGFQPIFTINRASEGFTNLRDSAISACGTAILAPNRHCDMIDVAD